MDTVIQKISARPGQRIIVTSDVHGHPEYMIRLLEKLEYSPADVLVVVGDLVDKGPESLRAVRLLMQMASSAPVFVSEGNVEEHRLKLLCDTAAGSEERFCDFVRWQQRQWGCGLLLEMLSESDISVGELTPANAAVCRRRLWEHFAPEIAFLRRLPTILEMGDYIFVHGGIPTDDLKSLERTDRHDWLKNDRFLEKGYRFSKCVVTGHWPVSLYRHEEADLRPLFEYESRIISMDGGCGLKEVGQLNALVFPNKDAAMEEITWDSYDGFSTVTALDRQEGKPPSLYIQYFDSEIDRLEERENMTRCRHLSSGRIFWAPSDFLYRTDDGNWHVDDYSDAALDVKPGDDLSVVFRNSAGCYAKSSGVLGWYYGRCDSVVDAKKDDGRETTQWKS